MKTLERHLVEQHELPVDFFWHDVRWYAVQRFVPSTSVTVLDVGAGAGRLGIHLARIRSDVRYRFLETIPSLEARLAAEFGPDANAAGETTVEAAVVMLLDVIEHQADDVTFLSDLVRRSGPGTRFVVTVPASPRLWSAWDAELGHFRRYTRGSLSGALRASGLRIVEVSYLFPELWPVGFLRRLRTPAERADPTAGKPEFRPLPRALNTVMRGVGRLTVQLRRVVPFGTSLLGVAEKPAVTA